MSDEYNLDGEGEGKGGGLRKQLEDALAKLNTSNDALAKYQASERKGAVREFLKAKGVPDENLNVADLYTGEDVSEDAVGKWFTTYGKAFGVASATSEVTDANAAAAAAVNAASGGTPDATRTAPNGVLGDPTAIAKVLADTPRTPEGYATLQKLGLMPK